MKRRIAVFLLALLGGCAGLPPGADFPRAPSLAPVPPAATRLGRQFEAAAREHPGHSGFHIVAVGADGFLMRMQMIRAAEKTLDLQYFIFRGDETGRLLTDAVLQAADRGVRVRVLIDDGETRLGDDKIGLLEAHPAVQIRIYNPFAYRGHLNAVRALEFAFNASRLDYRMHNKLLVVDNAMALIGGRNIGDEYFQIDPDAQFADDDVFAAGPIVQALSGTFVEFWNSALSIPAEALNAGSSTPAIVDEQRRALQAHTRGVKAEGSLYLARVASGEPLGGILGGRTPLVWAPARLIADSPDKKQVESGAMVGRLMQRAVADTVVAVQSELLMITPYLIPGEEGLKLLTDLRQRGVRVRILTSSLEASSVLLAHSGYMHYREPLIESGVELFEIRSLLGNSRGSGQTAAISRHGNYSLHAKLFVFDRRRLFIGSMNFDQRSMHLNTEIGLIIDSPVLAEQLAARFAAMAEPANAYRVRLREETPGGTRSLVWETQEGGASVTHTTEPARSAWQRIAAHLLSLLPLDSEL